MADSLQARRLAEIRDRLAKYRRLEERGEVREAIQLLSLAEGEFLAALVEALTQERDEAASAHADTTAERLGLRKQNRALAQQLAKTALQTDRLLNVLREEEKKSAALARELAEARTALELIRDGRCSCGYRFKWTGMQMRCENCGQHYRSVPPYIPEIARAALALPAFVPASGDAEEKTR